MQVVRHPEADEELEAAALWYEERQPGLGDDFLNQFESTLRCIMADPERWHKIRGENRKRNFDRFPHAICLQRNWRRAVSQSGNALASPTVLLVAPVGHEIGIVRTGSI